MTPDLWAAIIRTAMQMLGVFAMANGLGDESSWESIVGGTVAAAGVAHMIYARWNTEKVKVK